MKNNPSEHKAHFPAFLSYILSKRQSVQFFSALLANPFLLNFKAGKIYKGPSKNLCVPGMNCYSCPAAAGSCPIGALQTISGSNRFHISFYVMGFLLLVGSIFGRLICGFFCLFGLLQDLLYRIPTPKLHLPKKPDRMLRYLKYLVLLFPVLLLPSLLTDEFGLGEPFFCQYLCPAGTIEAGIPLLLTNPPLQQMVGALFHWKLGIAILIVLSAIFIYRPFCRYLCPLGAFYALFNKISLLHLQLDTHSCTSCGRCEKVCPMEVKPLDNINSTECIRCGKCQKSCASGAITWSIHRE